jgi:hydroxymethylpyrimidine pyrophosphatase-like HAD family hydrolase
MFRGVADALAPVEHELTQMDDLEIVQGSATTLEVTSRGTNKGAALRLICQALHVPVDRVLAFGDSPSDRELLEAAGWGVAVANASEPLRAIARDVTLSNNEDGVGIALRKYFPARDRFLDARFSCE